MSRLVTASARVQLTVEFDANSWSEDCKLDQVFDQASAGVKMKVQRLIAEEGGRIIGEPTVVAVLVERKP